MKYAGVIGFVNPDEQEETAPGVLVPKITERRYKGDVLRRSMRWQDASQHLRNINISNEISILADPYAYSNIGYMAYAYWLGQKWKIVSAEIQPPRIVFTIGDLYHEDKQD